ncbi:hypothetical protein O6H91_23G055500 [Diphasiastrum complanatum]|uniref:Uncharacterized protein n=1 Tax=Diphasiastrum complanatum TaxID=34168 RepID=A0ACC2ACR8_DIPCM|nr:hypothetical protein O6H91_23G055500 [Diphasiastrum complanatum]
MNSSDDADRSDSNCYQEGLEDSIRRCEELLSYTPLAFLPSQSRSKANISKKTNTVSPISKLSSVRVNVNIERIAIPELEWKKNMELLGGSKGICLNSKFDPQESAERCQNSDAAGMESAACQKAKFKVRNFQKLFVNEVIHRKNGSVKKRWSRESQWSSTSDDWTFESTQEGCTSSSCSQDMLHKESRFIASKENNESKNRGLEDGVSVQLSHGNYGKKRKGIEEHEKGIVEDIHSKEAHEKTSYISQATPQQSAESSIGVNTTGRLIMCQSNEGNSSADDLHSFKFNFQEPQIFERIFTGGFEKSGKSKGDLQNSSGEEVEVIVNSSWKEHIGTLDNPSSTESSSKCLPLDYQLISGKQFIRSLPKAHCAAILSVQPVQPIADAPPLPQDRLHILAKPKTEFYKRLAELRAYSEACRIQQCSFKPTVGRKPNPSSPYCTSIVERLMEIRRRMEFRKLARKSIEKEELDSCSFWPQTNSNCRYLDKYAYQPIQDRLYELQKRRRERIERALNERKLQLTFKPDINQNSVRLFKQRGLESVDVADRLTTCGQSIHLDCKQDPQESQITFAPEINSNTDYIIASSKHFGGHRADFFSRQQHYMQLIEEKKKKKEREVLPADFTFRPNIGNASLILEQSMWKSVFQESASERVERLAYRDKDRQLLIREKVSEEYYAQFNFQPEIDDISKLVGRSTSIKDLYSNRKGKKVKEALEQAARDDFQQKCPFRPEVSINKSSKGELQSLVLERRQNRKERAKSEKEYQTMRELQEMKECTFKPSLNSIPPKETSPILIKGLERHLQLQEIAKQMRKDKEDLEKKVFFSHVCYVATKHNNITIFALFLVI